MMATAQIQTAWLEFVIESALLRLTPWHGFVAVALHLVGLEYWVMSLTCGFSGARVGSCCELVLVGESAEDGPAAYRGSARLITRGGWVSAWTSVSCPRCGVAARC